MSVNLFSYIKSRIAILDVVNKYTAVRKTGNYWKGCCPFHVERTASFTVSPDKNIFYCFGCHSGGDIITFIAKAENMEPLQAAYHLAEQYALDLPDNHEYKSPGHATEKKHYWNLCGLVAQWCHENLLKSSVGLQYFKQRGITTETIKLFKIGYFPSGPRAIKKLLEYVKPSSYLAHDLLQASILTESKAHLYSPFEERLIFPIKDTVGRFCGFGGRVFMQQDERSKYYNSKEHDNFLKGSLIFGFDLAKQSIQKQEKAFLVEGYTDCIAMVQGGFTNTIATLGTACTLEHLKTIARHAVELYIIYDGDEAGHNAILRLTELCWQVNLELKVVQLPKSEDPASFLQKGGNLIPLIKESCDIFNFFILSLGADFSSKSLQEKIRSTKQLMKIVISIQEPLKRDFLLQNASKVFQVPLVTLKRELARLLEDEQTQKFGTAIAQDTQSEPVNHLPLKTISDLEKKLFSVIINNIALFQEEEWHFIDYFSEPLQDILKKITVCSEQGLPKDFVNFFEMLNLEQKEVVTKLLLEFQEYVHKENFNQLFAQFQKKHWKAIVAVFKIKVAKAEQEGNKNLVQKLLLDFQRFKKKLVTKGHNG